MNKEERIQYVLDNIKDNVTVNIALSLVEECDELQQENKQLKEEIKQLQKELEKADSITQSCIFNGKKDSEMSFRNCLNKMTNYKNRIDKAIEKIELGYVVFCEQDKECLLNFRKNILETLKGSENND